MDRPNSSDQPISRREPQTPKECLDIAFQDVLAAIESRYHVSLERLETLYTEIRHTLERICPDMEDRFITTVIVLSTLTKGITLYALGFNQECLFESYNTLEYFLKRDLSGFRKYPILGKNPLLQSLTDRDIQKKGIDELALIFKSMKVWEQRHLDFTRRLHRLRNALIHKDLEKLSKIWDSKIVQPLDVEELEETKLDCAELILSSAESLALIIKERIIQDRQLVAGTPEGS
ncbi:MAG: hypothetical protein QF473_32010 [Planctomycetota bacterium]|jgi:hypothetical protein|nr:hypothetical protein [Planctomycetota bacterium]MDP6503960.1 hypothetical protein [Planctomycetota bacterium]